jgi:hypothetical protein
MRPTGSPSSKGDRCPQGMGAVRPSMCTYRRQWVSATVYSVICGPADAGAPGQEVENVLAHGITHPMGSTQKPLLAALGQTVEWPTNHAQNTKAYHMIPWPFLCVVARVSGSKLVCHPLGVPATGPSGERRPFVCIIHAAGRRACCPQTARTAGRPGGHAAAHARGWPKPAAGASGPARPAGAHGMPYLSPALSPAPHLRHAPGPRPCPTLPHLGCTGAARGAPASRPRRWAGACAGRAARPGSPAPAASAPPGRRPRPARAAPRAARRSAAPARRPRLAPEPAGAHAGRPRWRAAQTMWFWLACALPSRHASCKPELILGDAARHRIAAACCSSRQPAAPRA